MSELIVGCILTLFFIMVGIVYRHRHKWETIAEYPGDLIHDSPVREKVAIIVKLCPKCGKKKAVVTTQLDEKPINIDWLRAQVKLNGNKVNW